MNIQQKELAYWKSALEEKILLKEIISDLPERYQLLIKKENGYLLESALMFETLDKNPLNEADEKYKEKKENSLTMELFSFSEKDEKGKPDLKMSYSILFQKDNFKLNTENLINLWVDDQAFREKWMKEFGFSKEEKLKEIFAEKTEDGLTELEWEYFEEIEQKVYLKSQEWRVDENFIKEIAEVFKKECIKRAHSKEDLTDINLKPLNII